MPKLVKNRDVLLRRTLRKNYPETGMTAVHSKSVTHDKIPIDEKKSYRVDTKINGMIFKPIMTIILKGMIAIAP